MKKMFVGSCSPETLFELRDPDSVSEIAFEVWVVRGLSCAFPKYKCIMFGGTFIHEGRTYRPDMAMVARDFSHWFIIEVELTSHSLYQHVLPQVRAFRYGEPQADCASSLALALEVSLSQARTLIDRIPYAVAVVANRDNSEWAIALASHGIQMLTVSAYSCPQGIEATEINGTLEVISDSLGFGEYLASLRSLRFAILLRVPDGRIQIRDQYGSLSWWLVQRDEGTTWLTREIGTPDIEDRRHVQLVATSDGYYSMR